MYGMYVVKLEFSSLKSLLRHLYFFFFRDRHRDDGVVISMSSAVPGSFSVDPQQYTAQSPHRFRGELELMKFTFQ